MPNAVITKLLEWLGRYWHTPFSKYLAPLFTSVFVWLILYVRSSNLPNGVDLCIAGMSGALVAAVWLSMHRLPKVPKGKAGIVIGIRCEDPAEEKQVKADYVSQLRQLIRDGGGDFYLIELPEWCLDYVENNGHWDNLLKRIRGHFLIHGKVRLRHRNGKPVHLLSFEGMVKHRAVPERVSKELALEFCSVFPRRVIIEKENDAFAFEATSEWTHASVRFIVGTAALISGDFGYAERLFDYVAARLKTAGLGAAAIARLLPKRRRELYSSWTHHLMSAYTQSRTMEYLQKCDEIASKLLQLQPTHAAGLLAKAICEFMLRRNVAAAHRFVTMAKSEKDSTWRYSRAFLHAYQGKMAQASADYRAAFKGVSHVSVPIQCEEFINIVLEQEPDKIQLYFCLGLINFHAKHDLEASARDLGLFLAKVPSGTYVQEVKEAKKLFEQCHPPRPTIEGCKQEELFAPA